MILQILILVIGFTILIKGADIFIDGSSSLARNFKVSKMLIGLTIVAFGTSMPEFAVSVKSLLSNNTDMLVGNVVGSNVTNILLILGIAALINPIKIKDNTVKKEIPLCILLSLMLIFSFLDVNLDLASLNEVTRSDALVIVFSFFIFIYYTISIAKNKKDTKNEEEKILGIGKSIAFILLGISGIILGSHFVVDSASLIATKIGVSQRVISLTIVAIGTSLPELVTTIVSAKKNEQDLLVGNIIGSNIFNIGIVLAIPIAIFGKIPVSSFNYIDIFAFALTPILLLIFSKTGKMVTRKNGIMMLALYVIYYVLVIFK